MADRLLVDVDADGRLSVSQWLKGELPSPVGAPVKLKFPLSTVELEDLRWYVEEYLRAPFGVYEQRGAEIAGRLPEWGRRLFGSVFGSGPARDAYVGLRRTAALDASTQGDRPEIVFRSPVATWLSLPWELARDEGDPSPLALGGVEVVRSLPGGMDPAFAVEGERLRVLMVISRPRGAGDVGYRMIARPLLERLEAVSGPVDLVVLRPPTLQTLVDTLAAARAEGQPFQVVHFDGHGALARRRAGANSPLAYTSPGEQGVLVFEAPGGGADDVPAERVAQVLAEARVPVVVLNACQSGAIGKDLEAAVATRLLAGGASSVVAMAYSVYAVAAAEFMTAFYDRLFAGDSVSVAVAAGRARLARNPLRPSPKGELPLSDWLVPVHYLRREIRFSQLRSQPSSRGEVSLDSFLDRARSTEPDTVERQVDLLAPRNQFVGRDGLFYDLEVAARLHRVVLLHGPGGTGKTEMAKAFGRWWRDTGGVDNPEWVIWHSFQPGLASFGLDGVLSTIGLQAFGPQFAQIGAEQRRGIVLRLLSERRLLIVLDNFECVFSMPDPASATSPLDEAGRRQLIDFLTVAARGTSAVLITSRTPEAWLGDIRRLEVGGLSSDEANVYADQLLAAHPAASNKRQEAAYVQLMQWLSGHPLSMRLILPQLEVAGPATVLRYLQGATPLLDNHDEGKLTSLAASITYSIAHLDEDTRRRLTAVSLFSSVADAGVLAVFSALPDAPAPYHGVSRDDWIIVLNRAATVGLLTPLGFDMYDVHPALPAYQIAQWQAENPSGHQRDSDAAKDSFLHAFADFADWLHQKLHGSRAGLAYMMIDRHRYTMGRLLRHALDTGQWKLAQAIAQPMQRFFDARGLHTEADNWVDLARVVLEAADGTPPAFTSPAGTLWMSLVAPQARRLTDAGQWDTAKRLNQQMLGMLTAQSDSPEVLIALAAVFHELGVLAQRQGLLAEAQKWYEHSLAIEERRGDRSGIAISYNQLGNVALLRGLVVEAGGFYRRAMTIFEELDQRANLAIVYRALGAVALEERRLSDAEDWCRRGLAIAKELGDEYDISDTQRMLGQIMREWGRLDLAEEWFLKALGVKERIGHSLGLAAIYQELGSVAQLQGQFKQAERWLHLSLSVRHKLDDFPGLASTLGALGLLAEDQGRAVDALMWTIRCVALFDDFPHPATGPGPAHLARLTADLGVEVLEGQWHKATGQRLPQVVLDFVQSHQLPQEPG